MSATEDIDRQLLELSQQKDAALAEFKVKAAELKRQRDLAVAQDKIAQMTDAERASLKAALDTPPTQTITPEPAASEPAAHEPEGGN